MVEIGQYSHFFYKRILAPLPISFNNIFHERKSTKHVFKLSDDRERKSCFIFTLTEKVIYYEREALVIDETTFFTFLTL